MSKSFATLVDEIEQELQDTGNAIWTAAELAIQLEDEIKEVSDYKPYIMMHSFDLESRTGTATTDTTDALVDATNAQFLSTDVDKVIFNSDDNTWAIVTAFVSSSQLTLSKDIMADGNENYRMYNKNCWDSKQINIEDVTDYLGPDRGVTAVEYRTVRNTGHHGGSRNYRNYTVEGDILTIDIDFSPPDSADSDADVEVFVWFDTRQRVSQLTDLAGAINNGNLTVGTTTISVDGLSGTEVVAEGTLLTIAGIRGTYMVTADVTLSSGGGDLVIFPGLLDVIVNEDVVTIIGSTLNTRLERLVVELTASKASVSKGVDFIGQVNVGGMRTWADYRDWGERKLAITLSELRTKQVPMTRRTYSRGGHHVGHHHGHY